MGEIEWNDVWVALQEAGAALRPVMEQPAPPQWAVDLSNAIDAAQEPVEDLCEGPEAGDGC